MQVTEKFICFTIRVHIMRTLALEQMPDIYTYYVYKGPSGVKCFISEPTEILMSLRRHQHVPCIKMRAFSAAHGFPFYLLLKNRMFYSRRTESFNHIISLRAWIRDQFLYKALNSLKYVKLKFLSAVIV